MKAYVGDGIAADFYRLISQVLEPDPQGLVQAVLSDSGQAEFVIARVREAIEADPRVAGRLALWARRLMGEALGQAQRVAAEREPLARLLAGGRSQPARRHRPDVRPGSLIRTPPAWPPSASPSRSGCDQARIAAWRTIAIGPIRVGPV